jgi:hypothetical protein
MASESKTSSSSGRVAVAIVASVLAALPVLYLLAAGPMAWLTNKGYVSDEFAGFVYYPVIAMVERSEWAESAWQAYIKLWV